ncbi:MAG TPA: preprotein translocase subunit SecE [Firmicutes bacterium]|jgi:preprotein translocase SecE subunit|nr:preprotein translocase subunit SecE [Bacillota bacterium]HAV19975.1 preprotein translocase subunit SecE [Bacillota bacterium]
MNIKKYSQEVLKESRRVRWPKREVLVPSIIVVVSIAVFAAMVLSLEDLLVGELLKQLRNAFESLR